MKYPLEVGQPSIMKTKAGTTILSVEAWFTPLDQQTLQGLNPAKEYFPLNCFSPYSVFKLSIISGGTSATGSIKPDKIYALDEKIRFFFRKSLVPSHNQNGAAGGSYNCQKVRFKFGYHKGKSPAEVLLENGPNVLQQQMANLQANLQKYSFNQSLLNACQEAMALFQQGKLNSAPKQEVESIPILTQDWKADPYNPVKVDEKIAKGIKYYKGSKISIDYLVGSKYPFVVSIEVAKAPIRRGDDGTINFLVSNALPDSRKKLSHYISGDDLVNMVGEMKMQVQCFKQAFFYSQYSFAWNEHFKNKPK